MHILKKFLSYYKPYRKLFYSDMACAVAVSAVDLCFPLLLSWLARHVWNQNAQTILTAIAWVCAGLLGLYILRYFCQYFITSWGHIMGAEMESDMRRDLFYHLQRLSFSYYDKNNTGDMLSKLVSDLFDISELAHHGPENLFISALKIAGAFIILLTLNVPMTLILIVITALMVLFSFRQNMKMRTVFFDNRVKIAGVNSQVQDSLAGIRVVKSFANEPVEKRKFDASNILFFKSKVGSYTQMGRYVAGNSFFEGLLYLAVLVSGGFSIAHGTLRASDLAVYVLYINIYVNPLEVLINFTEQFQKGYAGFKRFIQVMDTRPDVVERSDAMPFTGIREGIEYRGVGFSYNEKEGNVLEHINIRIPAGRTVALVGPSGGGKSTLCSLLPRFYDVSAGSITIDGVDIRAFTLESLRGSIGVVQQDVYLFAGSVKENIAYGRPGATDAEIEEAAKAANIHEFVASLPDGYDTYVGERGVRLSGGQKQRISIARVFLKNPPILILDEATSALDNESERRIQQSLERLSEGRTTIVIAHRLSTIRRADEIIVITDDGIVERGDHRALLARDGIYARYYNMQFEGLEEDGVLSCGGGNVPLQ